jgi:BolA protein
MNRVERIKQTLTEALKPNELEIMDESAKHRGRKDQESHMKLLVVSAEFKGMPLIARHRLVKDLLKEEFSLGMHALSLHLLTPEEWEKSTKVAPVSPPCRGGES